METFIVDGLISTWGTVRAAGLQLFSSFCDHCSCSSQRKHLSVCACLCIRVCETVRKSWDDDFNDDGNVFGMGMSFRGGEDQ